MKTYTTALFLFVFSTALFAQNSKLLSKDVQIKMASQVAPEEDQADVTVYGYDKKGNLFFSKKAQTI